MCCAPTTISVKDVREIADRYHGAAVVRFANGDVARGTFKNGALRGPATLLCPDEPPHNGEIGRDGTVQE